MRYVMASGSILLLLSACSGGADTNQDGKVSTEEMSKELASGGSMKMKAGLWETKISFKSVDAKGMPDAVKSQLLSTMGKGVTIKSCLTQEQVDKPGADFFGTPQGSNCTFEQLDRRGNRMKVAMTCKPDGKTVIQNTMEGQFSEYSYAMDMQQKTSGTPMGDIMMSGKIESKRVGECPA